MARRIVFAVFATLIVCGTAFGSCTAPQNQIEAENCLPGTAASQWQVNGSGDTTIQGFATDISVNVGDTISFKISTPASAYTIGIFRIGYYGGLGARKVATVTPSAKLPQTQPACITDVATRLYDCGTWGVSASWTVPSTAVSGVYMAVLVRSDTGGASQIIFVVRNDASTSDMIFQTSDESWQAYNPYGGHSLYGANATFDLTNRAYKVSYNRPFNSLNLENETWFMYAEYPMVRWLEKNGYDLTYFSSVDSARNGSLLKNHKVYLSVGHDEYVSGPKRDSVEAARDAGVNLAFFSGNEFFWKTRWENSIDGNSTPYRTLVCYKETIGPNSNPIGTAAVDPADPPTWTGTWRDPIKSPPADGGRPENALTGQLFRVNGPGSDNTNLSIKVPAAMGKLRFWRNTPNVSTQAAGATWTLPAATLGYEWDAEQDNGFRPAGLFDLSSATYALTSDYLQDYGGVYGVGSATHKMSLYRASSGALVFGAGTVQWSWGLDASSGGTADVNMQQATVNLFADMGVQPATLQSGLVAVTKSSDTTPPTSTITAPANGASVTVGTTINVSGTASDPGGVAVAGVEVSVDGGVSWHPATGTSSWSYSWAPCDSGSANVLSRAVDDSGNLEIQVAGIRVNVTAPGYDTIFCPNTVPGVPDQGADSSVELGVKFTADTNGTISGIRYYKSAANTGTHIGDLWTASGTLLASATFANETASGWQQVNFATPVSITANTVYVASYHTTVGHYAEDDQFFATSSSDRPPLHALKDGTSSANGVYSYGTGSTFPTVAFSSANYYVDVAFVPAATATSIAVAPTSPSIQAGAAQQFTATGTFSDGSIRDITAQATWRSSNTAVASINGSGLASSIAGGSTTISAAQGSVTGTSSLVVQATQLKINTVSLPAGVLNQSYSVTTAATGGTAPYNWSLISSVLPPGLTLTPGGKISGVPSVTGTFSFSVQVADGGAPQQTAIQALSITVAPPPSFFTIWPSTAAPTTADAGADSPVELGILFKADANGSIAGVRFYKSTANSGTHVGNLWDSSGKLLASATFSGESASGWQQVNFATPVTVTANTVYVASYHSTIGHYSEDDGFFTTNGVDNPPLHALKDGVSGANGVYAYGASSVFPTQAFQGANYWIDVVFQQSSTLNSIAVTPANPGVQAGGTQQFTATGTYSDGSTQNISSQVTWSSSKTAVATINSSGLASGLAGGSTNIGASQGSISGNTVLTVQPANLTITTASLAGGVQNQPYSATLAATGGTPPLTWSLSNQTTLPPGLSLSTGGQITGTPTGSGTTTFTVQAADSATTPQVVTAVLSIAITPNACPCTISGTISGAGGPQAKVTLSGTAAATTTADSAGGYSFKSLANGSYSVTPSLSGFSFNPPNQAVTIAGADPTPVNFTSAAIPPILSVSPLTIPMSATVGGSNPTPASFTVSNTGFGTLNFTASSDSAWLSVSPVSGTAPQPVQASANITGLAVGSYTGHITISAAGVQGSPATVTVNLTVGSVSSGIVIDAAAVKDQNSAASSVTSATFSTKSANELLLAFIATDANSSGITVTGVTGGGLNWALVGRTNAQLGTSEIWRAFAPTALTSVSVKATLSQNVTSSMTVMSFSGVDSTGTNGSGAVGNIGSNNGGTGAPTVQLSTTRNNSLLIAVGNDWDNATARTLSSGQTLVHQSLSPNGDTYWVQRTTSPVPLGGTTVTVGDTAPTADRWNLSVVEVRTP